MGVLFRLSEFDATIVGLLDFLERIRASVDPAAKAFRENLRKDHSYTKPLNAFYFALVLQRWEREERARCAYERLPWKVEVCSERSILTGVDEPLLWVCKRILRDEWKPVWSIKCEELLEERQILPEQQRELRRTFGLRPRDGCMDPEFFQDKRKVLG